MTHNHLEGHGNPRLGTWVLKFSSIYIYIYIYILNVHFRWGPCTPTRHSFSMRDERHCTERSSTLLFNGNTTITGAGHLTSKRTCTRRVMDKTLRHHVQSLRQLMLVLHLTKFLFKSPRLSIQVGST